MCSQYLFYIFAYKMGKKIFITEKQEQSLLEHLIVEQRFPVDPNKVLLVKRYLDKNFKKGKRYGSVLSQSR